MEATTTKKVQDSSTNLQATDLSIKKDGEDALIKDQSGDTFIKKEHKLGEYTLAAPWASSPDDTVEIDSDPGYDSDSTGGTIEHDIPSVCVYRQVPDSHNDVVFRANLETQYARIIVQTVRNCAQQLKKPENSEEEAKHKLEEKYQVTAILEGLCVLQKVTSKFCKAMNLQVVLKTIMEPARHFSVVSNQTATKLHEKFDLQHWGEVPGPTSPQSTHSAAAGVGNASVSGGTSRRKKQKTTSSAEPSRPDVIEILQFEDDHPVFGNGGVMHGIKVRVNKTKNSKPAYFLDKTKARKRADVVGHNGLTVGDCWPYQLCLVRDGVHGSSQGGIYGTKSNGAFSIIVRGESAYAGIDDDVGEKLYYSGSGSLDNEDPATPKATAGTQALQRSAQLGQAIRVIRGPNEHKVGAPRVGLRYDGLYQVVGQVQKTNSKGGAYIVFELEREEDQPARDKTRPNEDEQRGFQAIKRAIDRKLR